MSLPRRSSFVAVDARALIANAPASAADLATSSSANIDASMIGDSLVRSASGPMETAATASASIRAWGIQIRFAASETATATRGTRPESIPKRSVMKTPLAEAETGRLQRIVASQAIRRSPRYMWPRRAGSPIKLGFRNLNSILSEPPAAASVHWHLADLAPEYPIADSCVDQHQREDEDALPPEHECQTGMRCRSLFDGDDVGDHVRPERDSERPEGRQEDQRDHVKGQSVPMALNADRQHDGRQGSNRRKDEEIGTFNPSMHDLEVFSQRKGENDNKKDEQSDRQIGDLAIGRVLDVPIAFSDQPTGAKNRIPETQPDAAKCGERTEPAEGAAGVLTVCDRKTLHQRANRHALDNRRDQRRAA